MNVTSDREARRKRSTIACPELSHGMSSSTSDRDNPAAPSLTATVRWAPSRLHHQGSQGNGRPGWQTVAADAERPVRNRNTSGENMSTTEQIIRESVKRSNTRLELWIHFLQTTKVKHMVELGVYRGDFAAELLRQCDLIEKYYMLDPWRHLDNWNKPANKENDIFEQFLSETRAKTEFAAQKRIILQGKTTEVIDQIPDSELDFAYIDGDHTLKGIAIDLIRLFPKVRNGGWIGGDDFSRTIWQHPTTFEPTLVFPFAVYFAEAVGSRIYALPNSQFLIEKDKSQSFSFVDLTGNYDDISLRNQFHPDKVLKLKISETFPIINKVIRKIKQTASK
jgi:hypothetical protein